MSKFKTPSAHERIALAEKSNYIIKRLTDDKEYFCLERPRQDNKYWSSEYRIWDIKKGVIVWDM